MAGMTSNNQLPSETSMGPVALTISDLSRSLAFYQDAVGLTLLEETDGAAVLGAGQRPLLQLTEQPGARHFSRRSGLYHFALLLPSRRELGLALRNLVDSGTQLSGGADHLVSEALYLDDPDGNGIEIYRDRPREQWQLDDGHPRMDSLALDYQGLLADAQGSGGRYQVDPGTVMGHVHLHVADLAASIAFYRDLIGFELQLTWGTQAAFLAAGGYHHHLGINTWAGVGAPPPPEGSAGLRHFVVHLPQGDGLDELAARLQAGRHAFEVGSEGLLTRDPSQNQVRFRSDPPRSD